MTAAQKVNNGLKSFNDILSRLIPVIVPAGVVIGFLFPNVFKHLLPYVQLLFGVITFSGALKLKATELGAAVKNPLPIVFFFILCHVIMPLVSFGSSILLFSDPDVIMGFILLFAGPTAVSGFIWVLIFKGDKALGLTLILLDTLLAPLIFPATISILIGASVTMNMSGVAVSLIFMVVVPTIIGVAVNETSRGKVPAAVCPYFDPLSKICLVLVIAANTTVVAPQIRFDDPVIWKMSALCIFLTTTGFLLSNLHGVIGKYGREKRVSLFVAGGLRNNSAVMTVAVTFFPEAALPAILSILFQQTVAAIMGRLLLKKNNEEQPHQE